MNRMSPLLFGFAFLFVSADHDDRQVVVLGGCAREITDAADNVVHQGFGRFGRGGFYHGLKPLETIDLLVFVHGFYDAVVITSYSIHYTKLYD